MTEPYDWASFQHDAQRQARELARLLRGEGENAATLTVYLQADRVQATGEAAVAIATKLWGVLSERTDMTTPQFQASRLDAMAEAILGASSFEVAELRIVGNADPNQ